MTVVGARIGVRAVAIVAVRLEVGVAVGGEVAVGRHYPIVPGGKQLQRNSINALIAAEKWRLQMFEARAGAALML